MDLYHDDPIEFEPPKRRNLFGIAGLTISLILGGLYVQSTLAANIALNSGAPIEFGQGFTQTVACSGNTPLTITPNSSFVNASGGGAHYLSSVTVSNIPSNCQGDDLTINAYGNTGNSALALFNSTSTSAVIYNNAGTFQIGVGGTGATVSSGSGTFTVTFTSPVATSASAYKITLQSGVHVPIPCADANGECSLGSVGPGGGKIFYVNAGGFSCGQTLAQTCRYLEAAPNTWNGGSSDPAFIWADPGNDSTLIGATAQRTAIGSGYANTIAIINQGNGVNTSAGAVRAYRGGGLSDWYLGNVNEMIALDNAQAYVSPVVQNYYATSEESSASQRRIYGMVDNTNWYGHSKYTNNISSTRPIRAF